MRVAVYGASGHTGRFVVAELLRRGHTPIAIARDGAKLAATLAAFGISVERRTARLEFADELDRALAGTVAVIHAAGPFLDTAEPLIEAALRNRIHYLDLAAEQASALATFERSDAPARERGVCVVPAAGFYGGLGDLLATAVTRGMSHVDRIEIAIALDRWWPTEGTRRTGERNTVPRVIVVDGRLERIGVPRTQTWEFPAPFGRQDVLEVPLTETILISRHLGAREVRNFMNQTPLRDLGDPATPMPVATDDRGRSDQHFLVDVRAWSGTAAHRMTASGRDIYAVTAPIVVEAVERLGASAPRGGGAFALGEVLDARDVLASLVRSNDIVVTDR